LAGTCTVAAGVVTAVVITERGYGYSSANPPVLDCPGGGAQTFTPQIDTSTGGDGCLGVKLTAAMQFTRDGSTWADMEERYVHIFTCVVFVCVCMHTYKGSDAVYERWEYVGGYGRKVRAFIYVCCVVCVRVCVCLCVCMHT
jgi:hypothetical protein